MDASSAEQEWFADEAFWAASYDSMFPSVRFDAAPAEVEQILALTRHTQGSVLDLACGPGRHSIPLAQRGFRVTGVDRSPFLLRRARDRAAEQGVTVEWVEQDMRTFQRVASFDLVLSLFTSFGFFRDDADNQRVLHNVSASLRPGGAFVLDMMGKEVLARVFNPTASHETPAGLVVHRRRVVDNWNRMENEWMIVGAGQSRVYRFSHWIYSAREISEMLDKAGFSDVTVFADYLGAPYGPAATRLVVVAHAGTGAV